MRDFHPVKVALSPPQSFHTRRKLLRNLQGTMKFHTAAGAAALLFLNGAEANSSLRSPTLDARALDVEAPLASSHYAVCGKASRAIAGQTAADAPIGYCEENGVFARSVVRDNDEILNIRCCSDSNISPNANIKQKNHPQCGSVWGYSMLPIDGNAAACMTGTYQEAVDYCDSAGMRMCTFDETMDGCTAGTGCNYDNRKKLATNLTPFIDSILTNKILFHRSRLGRQGSFCPRCRRWKHRAQGRRN